MTKTVSSAFWSVFPEEKDSRSISAKRLCWNTLAYRQLKTNRHLKTYKLKTTISYFDFKGSLIPHKQKTHKTQCNNLFLKGHVICERKTAESWLTHIHGTHKAQTQTYTHRLCGCKKTLFNYCATSRNSTLNFAQHGQASPEHTHRHTHTQTHTEAHQTMAPPIGNYRWLQRAKKRNLSSPRWPQFHTHTAFACPSWPSVRHKERLHFLRTKND